MRFKKFTGKETLSKRSVGGSTERRQSSGHFIDHLIIWRREGGVSKMKTCLFRLKIVLRNYYDGAVWLPSQMGTLSTIGAAPLFSKQDLFVKIYNSYGSQIDAMFCQHRFSTVYTIVIISCSCLLCGENIFHPTQFIFFNFVFIRCGRL